MKSALLSTSILALSEATVLEIPLQKHISTSGSLKDTNQAVVSNVENSEYYIDVTLGTPPQNFKVLLDTSVGDLMLPSSGCSYSQCGTKHVYDSSSSTSYVKKITDFSTAYGSGSLSGTQSMDTMNFGGMTIPFQEFAEITTVSGYGNTYLDAKYDGVLGMGFAASSVNGVSSPFYNLLNEDLIPDNVFGLYLGNSTSEQGTLTLGGQKEGTSVSYWFPQAISNTWTVKMYNIQIENVNIVSTVSQATFDSATPYIVGPSAGVAALAATLGGWLKEDGSGLYEIGCDLSLPDLEFGLSDGTYTRPHYINAGTYLFRQGNTNTCTLGLQANDFGEESSTRWVLGGVFLRAYNTVYDLGTRKVGTHSV